MNNDQLSSLVWFALGLAVCLGSLQYKMGTPASPATGFMPFLSGAAICFFSGAGFIHATHRRKKGEKWAALLSGMKWQNALVILLSLLAYALLMVPLGFFICTVLFVAFLLRAIVPQRWTVVFLCSFLTAAASYLVFEVWLKAQLPKGPLGI
ncbi:MAG TPA: tripartite tricarboxylate transporter TctB family protein [Thermodesulfobacteriota bacterium]|nr:tripartite tricarboxylate transporter TctB family protein [Thermodesulfobacteriota bacterium]